MITELLEKPLPILIRGFKMCLVLIAIVFGWFGTMATVMVVSEIAPASIAIVSDATVLASFPRNINLMRSRKHALILTSNKPGYVRQLYQSGVWLVLPALRNGCLDLNGVKNGKQS